MHQRPRLVTSALLAMASLTFSPVQMAQESAPPPATPAAAPAAPAPDSDPFAKLRAEFIAKADEIIQDRNYDVKSTEHYKIKTYDPRLIVGEVASLLESFRAYFEGYWPASAELKPYSGPSRVYLFYSKFKYTQLLADPTLARDLPIVGHYMGALDLMAMHTDTVGLGDLPDVLVHEATHQLVTKRLYGGSEPPSIWVSEGLASYFGWTLRDPSKGFQAGRVGGKGATFFKEAPKGRAREASERVGDLRRLLKREDAFSIDDLIHTDDRADFYNEGIEHRYTASWLLVHWLLHADGGARLPAFVAYMKHEAKGERGAEVFYRDLGLTPEKLEASFNEYVDNFKAR